MPKHSDDSVNMSINSDDNDSTIEAKPTPKPREKKPRSEAQIAAFNKMIEARKNMGNIHKEKKEINKQIRSAEEVIVKAKKERLEKKLETVSRVESKKGKKSKPVEYSSSDSDSDSGSDSDNGANKMVKKRSKKPVKVIINNQVPNIPPPPPSPQVPRNIKPTMLFI